jgi:hypothetical protein
MVSREGAEVQSKISTPFVNRCFACMLLERSCSEALEVQHASQ